MRMCRMILGISSHRVTYRHIYFVDVACVTNVSFCHSLVIFTIVYHFFLNNCVSYISSYSAFLIFYVFCRMNQLSISFLN